jgi:hypothetical protein
MRSKAQAPPRQIKINQNAPGADERRARVQKALTEWMATQLEVTGLDKRYTLSDAPLKAGELGG